MYSFKIRSCSNKLNQRYKQFFGSKLSASHIVLSNMLCEVEFIATPTINIRISQISQGLGCWFCSLNGEGFDWQEVGRVFGPEKGSNKVEIDQ